MSVTVALSEILARARTVATQVGTDANQSPLIDDLGGFRALLNHALLEVYRRKAKDEKFYQDIVKKHTVAITTGTGTFPPTGIRELMGYADITDANNALITYFEYPSDYFSTAKLPQLGYVMLDGTTIRYTAPSPTLETYTGNLYLTVGTLPAIGSDVEFPSEETADDVILTLARGMRNETKFQVADVT